jgi:hypothetical protein
VNKKTTTISIYEEDRTILDAYAKTRKETYRNILHRILKKEVKKK